MNSQSTLAHSGKLKVFLSYSRKDSAFVQELLIALELLGFDAYLDKEDIAPGELRRDNQDETRATIRMRRAPGVG